MLVVDPGELPPAPPGPAVSRNAAVRKELVADKPARVTLKVITPNEGPPEPRVVTKWQIAVLAVLGVLAILALVAFALALAGA